MLLTASDGTALTNRSLQGEALVDDPLAWTELHLTFDNPEDRVLEGRFQFQLPERADIARFAMKVHGRWMEGEVVERARAQQVYEDHLHRRQDPALLEHEAGNQFSARVFPIQPEGEVEIILSWSQTREDGGSAYTLPLLGLPALPQLDLRARVQRADGEETITLNRRGWRPDADFVVPGAVVDDRMGVRRGDFLVAPIQPELDTTEQEVDALFVLMDSSASRAHTSDQDIETMGLLSESLGPGLVPTPRWCSPPSIRSSHRSSRGVQPTSANRSSAACARCCRWAPPIRSAPSTGSLSSSAEARFTTTVC